MFATDSLYLLMLGSGLLGGAGHCAGMCGPIVAAYTLGLKMPLSRPLRSTALQILYNAGRITTYSIVGGIMGLTGSFSGVVRSIDRFQNLTMAAIGLIMIVLGVANLGIFSLPTAGSARGLVAFISGRVTRVIRFISETHSSGSVYAIGLATGFIPCGLLYTAYIGAAGAGASAAVPVEGFLRGALLLFLFGLGTVPALFFIGELTARRGQWIRSRLSALSTVFMIAMGVILIYRATGN